MRREYDPIREGWSLKNDDGWEVSFTPDPKKKKKSKKSGSSIGDMIMAVIFWIVLLCALINFIIAHPLVFIIPAVLIFIYWKYRNDPGTMGLVAKGIKYLFIAFIVFQIINFFFL